MLQGINEILPDQLSKRHDMLDKVLGSFISHGYKRITTPSFEPFSDISKGWGSYLKEESIKFISDGGAVMALRPEMTSSIARLITSRIDDIALPQKLYYAENVFRKNHILRKQEFMQVGMESLGESSAESDVDMVKVVVDVMTAAGINNFRIELGHVENVKDKSEEDIKALATKHFHNVSEIPPLGDESVLEKNSYLSQFAQVLKLKYPECVDNVIYNRGLVQEMAYYTGVYFNVLVDGIGHAVGSGGRYDDLYQKYGHDVSAIGFALEFEKLAMCFEEM